MLDAACSVDDPAGNVECVLVGGVQVIGRIGDVTERLIEQRIAERVGVAEATQQ